MAQRKSILERVFGGKQLTEKVVKEVESLGGTQVAIKDVVVNAPVLLAGLDPLETDDSKLIQFYKQMDADAIISSSLDLYADNATQSNPKTGHVAAVESQDLQFKNEINEFLWDFVKVDTEAWDWVRRLVRDGKLFLDTKAIDGGTDWSFVPVENPSGIFALVKGQHDIAYFLCKKTADKNASQYYSTFNEEKSTEDQELQPKSRYIAAFYKPEIQGEVEVGNESVISGKTVSEKLNVKNGRSLLYSVKTDWQALCALEDAIFQSRIAKSRNFRLVQIDVADSNNDQANQMVNSVKNAMRSSESINAQENRYVSRQSPIPLDDFVYTPVRGAKGAVTITPVGTPEGSAIPMQDVEHFRNKVFAGLAVLKAYLGFEETTPGGLGDSTLTMLDERLGRRIKRIQTILKQIIKDIVIYYWINSDTERKIETLPKFEIELGQVSTKEEREAIERLNKSIDTSNNFLSLLESGSFENMYSTEKVFKFVFNKLLGIELSAIDTSADKATVPVELKQLAESKNIPKYNKKARKLNLLEGKMSTLMNDVAHKDLGELLKTYDVFLESEGGNLISLYEASKRPAFKKVLNEKSYKELKQKTKATDPLRVAKSKKLTVKYLGIDENNFLAFRTTAEDPKANAAAGRPTSYETKVSLKDLAYVLRENMGEDNPLNDKELVQLAMQGDVAVACDCPASMYWGQQYNGTKQDYSIVKNTIEPTRNKQYQTLCKHVITMLTVMPFWWNSIVRDLRKKGLLSAKTPDIKQTPAKEEKPETTEVQDLKDAEAKL